MRVRADDQTGGGGELLRDEVSAGHPGGAFANCRSCTSHIKLPVPRLIDLPQPPLLSIPTRELWWRSTNRPEFIYRSTRDVVMWCPLWLSPRVQSTCTELVQSKSHLHGHSADMQLQYLGIHRCWQSARQESKRITKTKQVPRSLEVQHCPDQLDKWSITHRAQAEAVHSDGDDHLARDKSSAEFLRHHPR
jgi:hypothetical protein